MRLALSNRDWFDFMEDVGRYSGKPFESVSSGEHPGLIVIIPEYKGHVRYGSEREKLLLIQSGYDSAEIMFNRYNESQKPKKDIDLRRVAAL